MGVLAWRKPAPDPSSYEDDEAEEDDEFFAGERICAPPEETRGNLTLRICVVALIATGGWWLARHPQSWQGLLPTNLATSSTLMEYRTPDPVHPPVAPPETATQTAPVPGTEFRAAPAAYAERDGRRRYAAAAGAAIANAAAADGGRASGTEGVFGFGAGADAARV